MEIGTRVIASCCISTFVFLAMKSVGWEVELGIEGGRGGGGKRERSGEG